jgi:1-acyl-sn-glycerol-3-phosphate acyltransferase
MHAGLSPARRSPAFARFFAAYSERLLRRRFASVRLMREGEELLARADRHAGPVLLAMNHASWWDPLVGLVLVSRHLPSRIGTAPMDLEQFQRFRFMKRLGMFGLDPKHPNALALLAEHVAEFFRREPRPLVCITPQGAFSDVRGPMRLRPGAASIAAAHPDALVLVLCVEYTFWEQPRPEILLRVSECPRPARESIAAWHRQLTDAMQSCADALAERVVARDGAAFEHVANAGGAQIHPVYDLLLRWRRTRRPA